jgi:hypothetical protein
MSNKHLERQMLVGTTRVDEAKAGWLGLSHRSAYMAGSVSARLTLVGSFPVSAIRQADHTVMVLEATPRTLGI